MDFKVLITDSAISDLKEIVEFVAQDDPVAAARLGEKLANHAFSLNTMPARFPLYDKTAEHTQNGSASLSDFLSV